MTLNKTIHFAQSFLSVHMKDDKMVGLVIVTLELL